MKFILEGGKMIAANTAGYIGEKAQEGSFLDQLNNFSDAIVGKEMEWIFKPVGEFMVDIVSELGHWFILNLPDIMGYGALVTAGFIMIGSMTNKGGLILAICILGGA
ncbi:hypothetical protein [Bacillus cereus group sp. BfR-BA-01356]|uniref:hypothetical protein n=1 Tax=Bacillus cereus group sp. BfR-BA-01356 TaxID=2920319 RepID=UPI001F5960F5